MTVIVLLILAGVSINAIIGDNGVINNAEKAKEQAREAEIREELEYFMFNYNASDYADIDDGLAIYLSRGVENKSISNFLASTDGELAIVEKDGKYYELQRTETGKNEYEVQYKEVGEGVKTILEEQSKLREEGESASAILLTQKTLQDKQGEGFKFLNGQTYVVLSQNLTGTDFDFNIPCGDPITIKIAYNMYIDNSNEDGTAMGRSAINLESGTDSNGKNATLNLYIYGNVEVNSTYGEEGETSSGLGAKGGPGGFAGIHVPETATLNLYGTGVLTAVGGNAGNGGSALSDNAGGGGRRWCWCWNRRKWWKWWKCWKHTDLV